MQATLSPKHDAPPHPTHTHTINGIVHTPNVRGSPPTHATVVVPDVCGLQAPCSPAALQPLCILRFSSLSPPHQPPITLSNRSVANPPTRVSFWLSNSLCDVFSLIFFVNSKSLFFIQRLCVWDAASSSSSRVQRIMALVAGVSLWTCSGLLGAAEAAGP